MAIPKNPSFTAKKQVSKCGSSNTPVLSKLIDAKIDSEEEEEACLPQSHLGVGTNDTDEEIDNSVNDKDDQVDPHLAKVIQFKRQTVLRSRMFTGYGGLEMGELLAKIVVQGWSNMFLQGDHRRKLCKAELTEFYINTKGTATSIASNVRVPQLRLLLR